MGSTNRVTSSISVQLPTFLLQIFRDFIQFLCNDGIGSRECELAVWVGEGRGEVEHLKCDGERSWLKANSRGGSQKSHSAFCSGN